MGGDPVYRKSLVKDESTNVCEVQRFLGGGEDLRARLREYDL